MKLVMCRGCGFPLEWERDIIILDSNPFSMAEYVNNTCDDCGHQRDGWTIKKIQPLIRKALEDGKRIALAHEGGKG